jgi:hypothetical protein
LSAQSKQKKDAGDDDHCPRMEARKNNRARARTVRWAISLCKRKEVPSESQVVGHIDWADWTVSCVKRVTSLLQRHGPPFKHGTEQHYPKSFRTYNVLLCICRTYNVLLHM